MLVEQAVAGPGLGGEELAVPADGNLADPDLEAMQLVVVPRHDLPLPLHVAAPVAAALAGPAVVPTDGGSPWTRHFAVLLVEGLAGARPLRQMLPLMSERAGMQLRRLQPLFSGGPQPRIMRVLTSTPSFDVVEMTLIVATGGRARAVAVRLERTGPARRPQPGRRAAPPWLCTDVEAA